jgi:hypothetical protein
MNKQQMRTGLRLLCSIEPLGRKIHAMALDRVWTITMVNYTATEESDSEIAILQRTPC